MNIRVRGISYYVEYHQQNPDLPTLILLHGFMGSGNTLSTLVENLKSGCNPVTVDLLGHGQTEGAELHYRFSTKEQIADLVKLISEQFPAPIFLYGYSMGARLALQVAIHRNDLIQGLILESGTFGIEDETEQQHRQSLDASRADAIRGSFAGFIHDWRAKDIFKSPLSDEELRTYYTVQENQNPQWMSNSLLGFGTGTMPCVRDQLSDMICPTLLIVGENDSKFIRINQTMNKEIPDSALNIVKDAGHRVHLEQPEKVSDLLKKFIIKNKLP